LHSRKNRKGGGRIGGCRRRKSHFLGGGKRGRQGEERKDPDVVDKEEGGRSLMSFGRKKNDEGGTDRGKKGEEPF